MQAFEHTCPAGHPVYKRVIRELTSVLTDSFDAGSLNALIATSRDCYEELSRSLQRGRDRLLEYNSCRPKIAEDIKRRAVDADHSRQIADYMEDVFDCIGIDSEVHSEGCLVITPTEQMVYQLPGLAEEGKTITYERDVALTFEDADYITWEHPLTSSIIDIVLTNEMGNTSVTATEYAAVDAGSVLMECLFSVESAPVEEVQSQRYLPPTMVRVLCDERGADHDTALSHQNIRNAQVVEIAVANKIVNAKKKILKAMLQRSEKIAQLKADKVLALAHKKSEEILTIEINRLKALSKVNPNIRADEVSYFEKQLSMLNDLINSANIRLDAIRIIVAT